ncbi:MAG: DUF4242 domain-containing protein [Chitinophagaceae bacterium]|nr:DUF4242 domain-containing protein [Chitinophagaceae bacterium]
MPIYMDLHILPGVKAKDVAEAHLMDTMFEEEHNCKCMTYWVDESRGHVFCLIDAPDKEVVVGLHNKSHGLVPHKIIEVQTSIVESFLGRVNDPEETPVTETGLKLINDPSYRIIMVTILEDPILLKNKLGKEKANELLNRYKDFVRQELLNFKGQEAEHSGRGLVASFISANNAISCALSIQQKIPESDREMLGLRIGINGGEPVSTNEKLFGDTIQLAKRLCFIAKNYKVGLTSGVIELASDDHFQNHNDALLILSPQDEKLLSLLFNKLEENWQNPGFNVADYCQIMAMSKSQLYRKILALSGFSPNELLSEFKLEKAKELMRTKQYNVTQITFDTGFSSPSYFTKCFKKKYGLLPLTYMDMLS